MTNYWKTQHYFPTTFRLLSDKRNCNNCYALITINLLLYKSSASCTSLMIIFSLPVACADLELDVKPQLSDKTYTSPLGRADNKESQDIASRIA